MKKLKDSLILKITLIIVFVLVLFSSINFEDFRVPSGLSIEIKDHRESQDLAKNKKWQESFCNIFIQTRWLIVLMW